MRCNASSMHMVQRHEVANNVDRYNRNSYCQRPTPLDCLLLHQVQRRAVIRNAHIPSLARYSHCRRRSFMLFTPWKTRQLCRYAVNVRLIYDVHGGTKPAAIVVSHEDE